MKKYLLASLGIVVLGWQVYAQRPNTTTKENVSISPSVQSVSVSNLKITQGKEDTFGPELNFSKTKHNFGKISQGVPVKVKFTFTNSGNANLVIKKATAGCGCTTPVWPQEPIAPGKTGIIEVGYDAKAVGNFVKEITVDSNAGAVKLIITGEVEVVASDSPSGEIKLPVKK